MCGYCGNSYAGGTPAQANPGYMPGSGLESVVQYDPVVRMSEEPTVQQFAEAVQMPAYNATNKNYSEGMYLQSSTQQYHFKPGNFLNNVPTEFVSCKDENQEQLVRALVKQAFEATTGKEMPNDIAIKICSAEEMKKQHRNWHKGIAGFSLNRRGFGVNEIFVKEDELARLMLTIGHEIGHVITLPMDSAVDEEAKAFAFSLAWMEAIKENNIGGLFEVINPTPARNGLHNVAFDFLAEQMKNGKKAFDVYLDLIRGGISINNTIQFY